MHAARLLQAGARVHPKRLRDGREAGEPRLWLPDREAPGLLVSRAIGDDLATTVGCTAQPSVRRWRLHPEDEFLVIASDGVWDMLPNEEVRARRPHITFLRQVHVEVELWPMVQLGVYKRLTRKDLRGLQTPH